MSHQTKWNKTIYEVYKDAEVPLQWTDVLKDYCDELGITFFTTPYDLNMVDKLDPYVPAFKLAQAMLLGKLWWRRCPARLSLYLLPLAQQV